MASAGCWMTLCRCGFTGRSFLRYWEVSAAKQQQVRYKQKNKKHYRVPHEAKERQKWSGSTKEKFLAKSSKTKVSPSWLQRRPIDDVWIRAHFPRPKYSITEAITMHQEYAHPTITDNLSGKIYFDIELDMKTSKKTKFLNKIKGAFLPPHVFDTGIVNRCIVFCKEESEQETAKSLGAIMAGGRDIISMFLDHTIEKDSYDFVLCTPDILPELLPIRNQLKDRFPNKAKGSLGADIEAMMKLYMKGISYESEKLSNEVGKLQIQFGKMDMPTNQLVENYSNLIETICAHRHAKLGPFITKGFVIAPPSRERFLLELKDHVPGFKEEEVSTREEESDEEEIAES